MASSYFLRFYLTTSTSLFCNDYQVFVSFGLVQCWIIFQAVLDYVSFLTYSAGLLSRAYYYLFIDFSYILIADYIANIKHILILILILILTSLKYLRFYSKAIMSFYLIGYIVHFIGSHKIINPTMKSFVPLLLVLLLVTAMAKLHLLRNVETELTKMVDHYNKGDTSHAFSIAVKVHFAIKALHSDLQLTEPASLVQGKVNCQDSLSKIIELANSIGWQERFQLIMDHIQQMQQSCTNADFKTAEYSESIESGFQNECALCVVILRVMENYVNYHKVDAADFVSNQFCSLLGDVLKPTCEAFIHYAGPVIIQTLYQKEPSDKVCLALGLCKDKSCKILGNKAKQYEIDLDEIPSPSMPSPWKWLEHLFVDHFGNGHFPAFDLDNDTYSDVSTFRGYDWRGSDCNEVKPNIYPGRKQGSKLLDHDCNGIYGLDNLGRLYQDKFCAPYKRMGLAVIGDSAGAHFSIPEKYFNVSMIKNDTYHDLLPRLANQLDLPQDSAYTAHRNTSYHSRSVYKYLRSWNLCNNNDFQNIAVNGATASNSRGNIPALSRHQGEDYPLLMFLELIGNDVCKKSFDSMTKVEDFEKNVIYLLDYLDHKVPAGSHLMIFGLGDGDVLYQNLHNETHPLNVTYGNVYDFLNCLKISPCWGWLNSNDTVRKFATERAHNLSKVYQKVIDEHSYNNFDVVYYDFPSMQILERKVMEGGDPKSMIQPCDGFHPNGQFHSYLADWIWFKLRTEHPDWIGQENPHNEQIKHIFGLNDLL